MCHASLKAIFTHDEKFSTSAFAIVHITYWRIHHQQQQYYAFNFLLYSHIFNDFKLYFVANYGICFRFSTSIFCKNKLYTNCCSNFSGTKLQQVENEIDALPRQGKTWFGVARGLTFLEPLWFCSVCLICFVLNLAKTTISIWVHLLHRLDNIKIVNFR